MAVVYEYKMKGLFGVPAQVVGNLCNELENTDEGLTPESFLNASRDESSPTHSLFEWNNDIAAEKYRLHQAQTVICNIVTKSVDEDEPVRAFINVRKSFGEHHYKPVEKVQKNDAWKAEMLITAKREMDAFVHKYQVLSNLDQEFSRVVTVLTDYLSA